MTDDGVLVIEAGKTEGHYWRDVWRYRELFYFLAWRDILVRYKQTVMGVAWAVIRPLLTMVVFTLVFGKLGKFPSNGVPYALLVYTAMLPWQFFATSLADSSASLASNANLISKVYFPRLIVPASAVITGFVDFLVAGAILVGIMAWYGAWPDWRAMMLPVFVAIAFVAAMGGGLLLAALNASYRDFRYIVPFIVQLGLYVSPVGFASNVVPDQWRLLYSVNPMVGVIDGFRWALLGHGNDLYLPGLAMSAAVSALLLAAGLAYFRRTERGFADVI